MTKSYPGSPPVEALRGVDLTIAEGEMVAVVGPSGSGKSTLLHVMGTLDRPTTGRVEVVGEDVAGLSDRRLAGLRAREIGFVFQQFHLIAGATALENVADGALYTGASRPQRREEAMTALERVGLEHRANHPAGKLSGGEQQRATIARALMGRPSLLLADEPTGNLDTATGAEIVELLTELNAQGVTVAVITHEPEVARRCQRTVHLRDGLVETERHSG